VRRLLLDTNTLLPIGVNTSSLLAFMVIMIAIGLLAFPRLERYVRSAAHWYLLDRM